MLLFGKKKPAHFTDYAKKLTEEAKKEKNKTISIDTTETLEPGTNDSRNVGYGVLKEMYRSLDLDRFWNWKTRGKRGRFSVDQILKQEGSFPPGEKILRASPSE